VWFKKKKAPICVVLSVCVPSSWMCVCVWERECSDKKSFLLTYFPTMLSSCWSGPHRALLVSRWCHRPDLPLLYKGFRYHCLCSHNTHSSRLLCSCKPKEQCYFLFQHYKAGLCRKLNRQNLYQTMLRVGWQYNPPLLAFQCVSLFLSVFIIIFFLPLYHLSRSLAPFLVGKRQRVHTQGSKQDKALWILKYISFFSISHCSFKRHSKYEGLYFWCDVINLPFSQSNQLLIDSFIFLSRWDY